MIPTAGYDTLRRDRANRFETRGRRAFVAALKKPRAR